MAEMMVTRSTGEKVRLQLWQVDRQRQRVGIDIPGYNARLIFTKAGGRVQILAETDRRRINPAQPATLHVSKSVYNCLAQWAGSILNSQRRLKEEKT